MYWTQIALCSVFLPEVDTVIFGIVFLRACYNFSAGEMMRSDYLFCTEETQTLSIEYSGRPTQKVLTNVPVNPNKHIILKGDYASIGLTNANFSVTLDEDWGTGSGTADF